MLAAPLASSHPTGIGALLQYWRKTRQLSQLALATEAEVSPRHICFLETGRARPSRDMVMLLASVLDVPLRERNALLLAAGFAPAYSEASIDAPELSAIRLALDAILEQQEPFPAVVMNRSWDITRTNAAATAFFDMLLDSGTRRGARRSQPTGGPANVLRLMFDPTGLRPHVENWEAVADSLVRRVQREAVGGVPDPATAKLLDEILAFPGVPARLRTPDLLAPIVPVIPVRFRKHGKTYAYFSTVTTLGTPQDITLQELRIECFFPADAATRVHAAALAGG